EVGGSDIVRGRVQALQVARQRADLLVGQLGGHRGHDVEQLRVALGGGAGAVLLEPALAVAGVLAGHVRVGRARVAGAVGAVARHAGRDATRRVARAVQLLADLEELHARVRDRKSTRLNSSHVKISYAVF